MMSACNNCGHKTNMHQQCNQTCSNCGHIIGTDTEIIGKLNDSRNADIGEYTISHMYHLEGYIKNFKGINGEPLFLDNDNNIYKRKQHTQ